MGPIVQVFPGQIETRTTYRFLQSDRNIRLENAKSSENSTKWCYGGIAVPAGYISYPRFAMTPGTKPLPLDTLAFNDNDEALKRDHPF
jgi:hypothetical protein